MSRKITNAAIYNFISANKWQSGNTQVVVLPNVTVLKLFGNEIAFRYNDSENTVSISNCGYQTVTTKERLNGIPGVRINQKKGIWYLNDKEWDGSLTDI